MADEQLTIDLQIKNVEETLRKLGTIGGALEHLSAQGPVGQAVGHAATSGVQFALFRAPLIAGIAALGAAFAGLTNATKRAAEAMFAFGQLKDTLGATTGETAALRVIGGALGLGNIRGLAGNVRRASLGGLGAEAASRFGLPISPLDVGSAANEGEILLRALSGLRQTHKTRGFSAALADARNLGLEDAIQVVRISDEMWAQILRDAQETQRLLGPEHQSRAVQLNLALSRLSEKWEFLKTLLLSALVPALEAVTNGLIGFLRLLSAIPGSGVRQQDIDAALNANTRALNANTRTIEQMIGIYGGGRRARGALPAAFGPGNGAFLSEAVRAGTIRLGAYAVSL